jgi:hypothetical protein
LLAIATVTLGFGRQIGEWLRRRRHIRPWAVLVIQLGLGIYGGYCGALVGRRAPAPVIRAGTLCIASGITVLFFVRAYLMVR